MTTTEFPKPVSSAEEFLVCTELLPAIRERYGTDFSLLEIPQILRSDRTVGPNGTVYFRNYEGDTYNDRWSEEKGGAALGTELSSEMVWLLEDFQRIDVEWALAQHSVGQSVKASAFDFQGWLSSFPSRKTQAVTMGISLNEIAQAEEFIRDGFRFTSRILSNGDFYPRNLVKLPNKIVVVDWGHWAGYRVCFVDYLVNVAAFAFIHMWNNDPWQKEFVHNLMRTFEIDLDDVRKAILIRSFEQALFWQQCAPQFVPIQVNHFKMALHNTLRDP